MRRLGVCVVLASSACVPDLSRFSVEKGDSGIDAESAPGAVERGNRFLAACVRHVLGSEPPTMAALFAAPARSSA